MVKAIRSLLVLVVIAALLSACGSGQSGSQTQPAPDTAAAQPQPADTQQPQDKPQSKVQVMHYFSDTLGQETFASLVKGFEGQNQSLSVSVNPMDHEAFKNTIMVMLAGNSPPDLFSYWAGARVQFVVDSDSLAPIDDMWQEANLDNVFPAGLANAASVYEGQKYLIPIGYHYAGMFYNPAVMARAGITEMPKTWDEFLTMAEQLKAAGVTPIALGSKNRWPAQFWFDYLLLRTAGAEYRAQLMAGKASYTDPEVHRAMRMWAELVDKGYFVPDANAYDWTDAADQVANGEAAITLMGTWITGYWNGNGLTPGKDYDFFEVPVIDPNIPVAALGPVDGFVLSAKASNPEGAKDLLAYLTDPEVQATWAIGQGALAPNKNVDPSKYNVVMQKASQVVARAATFAFNYDLATTPPMADAGLNMFAQFMDNPSGYADYLEQAQQSAAEIFK